MAHLRPMAALRNYRDGRGRMREGSFDVMSNYRLFDHSTGLAKTRSNGNFLGTHILDNCVVCPVCKKESPTTSLFVCHFKRCHEKWYELNVEPVPAINVSWCDGGYTSMLELSEFSNYWVSPNNYQKIAEGIAECAENKRSKKQWTTQAAITMQAVIDENARRGGTCERIDFEVLLKAQCGNDAYENLLKHLKKEVKCFTKFDFGAEANRSRSNAGRLYCVSGMEVPLADGLYIGETASYENTGMQRAFSHLYSGEVEMLRMLQKGMVVSQICVEKDGEEASKVDRLVLEEEIRKYLKETLKLNTLNKVERHGRSCTCSGCVSV